MTLRTRILLAFGVAILIPLVLLAFGLRQEMNDRLTKATMGCLRRVTSR